ncbi:MAG: hypothetical protein K2X11_15230 [Acetobacteraceae bacterium]|nr:hypothetical protein [Acetobacteraceae bacterium]
MLQAIIPLMPSVANKGKPQGQRDGESEGGGQQRQTDRQNPKSSDD